MSGLKKNSNDEMRRRRIAHTAGRKAFRSAKKRGDGGEAEVMARFQNQGIDVSSNVFRYDATKDTINRDRKVAQKEIDQKKRNKLKGEESLSGNTTSNTNDTISSATSGSSKPKKIADPFGGGGTIEGFGKQGGGDPDQPNNTGSYDNKLGEYIPAGGKRRGFVDSTLDEVNQKSESTPLTLDQKIAQYEKRDAEAAANPLMKSRSVMLDEKVASARALSSKGDSPLLSDPDSAAYGVVDDFNNEENYDPSSEYQTKPLSQKSLGEFLDVTGVRRRATERREANKPPISQAEMWDKVLGGHSSSVSNNKIDFSNTSNQFAKPDNGMFPAMPEPNDQRTGFAPRVKPINPFKPLFLR